MGFFIFGAIIPKGCFEPKRVVVSENDSNL
jgi:hypothetical protein